MFSLKNQKGFTLVELMVVLLIIGILIAVAVPVFLGVRNRAYDNESKQALTNVARLLAADFASDQAMPTAAVLAAEETSYAIVAGVAFPAAAMSGGKVAITYDINTGKIGSLSQAATGGTFQAIVSTTDGSITQGATSDSTW